MTPLFQPIKTKRAFEEISGEIEKLIFKGTLQPGVFIRKEENKR